MFYVVRSSLHGYNIERLPVDSRNLSNILHWLNSIACKIQAFRRKQSRLDFSNDLSRAVSSGRTQFEVESTRDGK